MGYLFTHLFGEVEDLIKNSSEVVRVLPPGHVAVVVRLVSQNDLGHPLYTTLNKRTKL